MSFNVDLTAVMQSATNFFASASPLTFIIIGTAIGAFVMDKLIGLFRGRK